jgi:hypothetical protein
LLIIKVVYHAARITGKCATARLAAGFCYELLLRMGVVERISRS